MRDPDETPLTDEEMDAAQGAGAGEIKQPMPDEAFPRAEQDGGHAII